MIERRLARYLYCRGDYNTKYLKKFIALKRTQSSIGAMIACCDIRSESSRLFTLNLVA